MENTTPLLNAIIIQLSLILISAAFSLAEVSLLTINRNKLESFSRQKNKKSSRVRAERLLSLLNEPAKFLATIQVGNTLTGFFGSAFAAENFSGYLTNFLLSLNTGMSHNTLNSVSVVTIIILLAYLSIVFSELVPKRVAMKNADTLAFVLAGPVLLISRIFAPVVFLLTGSTNAMLRLFGIDPKNSDSSITEEEIRLMIDLGSAGGAIKSNEKEFLHNVFEFDNKTAGEVMTHRRDAILLNLGDDDDKWEKTITENRYSNFPVYGKGPDDIKGIIRARDYFVLKQRTRDRVMGILKPAWFIPTSVKTDRLFRQMKKSRNHFAITVDEHGSVMGIITMNDLLEELVGELENDSTVPVEKPLIEKTSDGWYINGAALLDSVARELSHNLPVDKYDTFAGFVFSLLGHIPEDGFTEELVVPLSDISAQSDDEQSVQTELVISILEVREHRLEKAHVKIQEKVG